MEKCFYCGHENMWDVTNYITHYSTGEKINSWYCKSCKKVRIVVEEIEKKDTSFPFGKNI